CAVAAQPRHTACACYVERRRPGRRRTIGSSAPELPMAADREPPTLADYLVTAVSPVLIMLMVGSLVFFLVEVLYAGQYSDRLLYSLFFFVIGTVLVARIAIQIDGSRAMLYGLGL